MGLSGGTLSYSSGPDKQKTSASKTAKSKCFVQQYFDSEGRYILNSRRGFSLNYSECKAGKPHVPTPINSNRVKSAMISALFQHCVAKTDPSLRINVSNVYKVTLLAAEKGQAGINKETEYVPPKRLKETEQFSITRRSLIAWADRQVKNGISSRRYFNVEHYNALKEHIEASKRPEVK